MDTGHKKNYVKVHKTFNQSFSKGMCPNQQTKFSWYKYKHKWSVTKSISMNK